MYTYVGRDLDSAQARARERGMDGGRDVHVCVNIYKLDRQRVQARARERDRDVERNGGGGGRRERK